MKITRTMLAAALAIGSAHFVIAQDISNMVEVQRGYKSRGFKGCLPNPWQERKVTNLHRGLAHYMGTGAPKPLG